MEHATQKSRPTCSGECRRCICHTQNCHQLFHLLHPYYILYHFARHICRVICRRGETPHLLGSSTWHRTPRRRTVPVRHADAARRRISLSRHLLQYVTGRAAGKRHNETPTVRKTPPLPLRSKLRKLQPQESYQVCPRLSRPPCGRDSLAVSRCEETCCSLRRVSARSLELFQPFGNVSSGIFKIPSECPHTANDVFSR